ncbi:MAG: M4 family metallopeptidase [Bacteroidia bacterium]|nr:M4 family metallopeptidase [Bacteroidia bacterium]
MKKIAAFLSMTALALNLSGQTNQLTAYATDMYYAEGGRLNFLQLKDSYRISQSGVADFLNSEILNNGENKVKLIKSEKDELGFTHLRFEITRSGISYANKTIIAHCKNGQLVKLNGDLYDPASPASSFVITEKNALNYALAKVNAKHYKWENVAEVKQMRQALNDPDFTYDPVGVKVLFEKDGKVYSAYRFNIYAEEPLYRANVFVDANKGAVLDEQNLICNADVGGTANTKYSGTQPITCDQSGSIYRLRETQRGQGIETYNLQGSSNYTAAVDFTNASTTWTWPLNHVDQGASDAHWGAEMTYDYYMNMHNRNSVNNNGQKLLSYVHYQQNFSNAFWDGSRMTYGDGSGSTKIFTALDICGHEITHGVTQNTGQLIYQGESGALNESFSDIFAVAIENYARSSNWNWKIGEDITTGATGLRNMANPSQFADPDTYGGTFYYIGSADNGGVHTNSNVGNFWFYLLVTGGSGTNDIGSSYNVAGIGMTDAAKIAYRALSVYFTSTTNYAQARKLTLQAARDLFGACSTQEIQTARAWYAVGVGPNYTNNSLAANFNASSVNFCSSPATVNFTNVTTGGLTYSWDFGDGSTSTGTNTSHTYNNPGSYTVKLKAFGCSNTVDSVVKTANIVINPPVPAPVVNDVSTCLQTAAILSATSAIDVSWYGSPFGGAAISTGSSMVVNNLVANNTYYAASYLPPAAMYGGIMSNSGGMFQFNSNIANGQYLTFNVVKTGTLNSVVIYANSAGSRAIQMRDNAANILQSTSVNLSVGANTVVLNFPITPGNNYRLVLNAGTTGVFRTTSNVSYPYNVGDCINITGSSQGSGWYYWFYKWEVTSAESCESQRVPVNITVNPNPVVSASASSTLVCNTDVVGLTGLPTGGNFSGPGVSGNTFNGVAAGASAIYTVTYNYTDPNGCSGASSTEISVNECEGMAEQQLVNNLNVYPNPSNNYVNIGGNSGLILNYSILDIAGKTVLSGTTRENEYEVDLNSISKGLYILNLRNENGDLLKTVKLVKE